MVRVWVELQKRIETEWKSMVSPCHEGNFLLLLCGAALLHSTFIIRAF